MPRELMDQPKTDKFAFPGLQDKCVPDEPVVPETQVEPQDVKKTRMKKEVGVSAVGRKPLKLGKAKG